MVADFVLRRRSKLTFQEEENDDSREGRLTEDSTTTTTTNEQKGKTYFSASTGTTIVSLTFPIPNLWPELFPGMHIFLTVPNLSRWQSHPFSISRINHRERTFTVHVKA